MPRDGQLLKHYKKKEQVQREKRKRSIEFYRKYEKYLTKQETKKGDH